MMPRTSCFNLHYVPIRRGDVILLMDRARRCDTCRLGCRQTSRHLGDLTFFSRVSDPLQQKNDQGFMLLRGDSAYGG